MTKLYTKKAGHGHVEAGSSDLESFFAWALKLCRRDDTDRVMVETPDFRVTWNATKKKPAIERKRRKGAK